MKPAETYAKALDLSFGYFHEKKKNQNKSQKTSSIKSSSGLCVLHQHKNYKQFNHLQIFINLIWLNCQS